MTSRGLVARYSGVVCDLDGVVYRGPSAVPHAVEALAAVPVSVCYATNNASRTPDEVAAHLRDLGLDVSAADVVTSSIAGAREVAQRVPASSKVLAVGGPGVHEALVAEGLVPVTSSAEGPVAVLQGYGSDVTAGDLAEAAYAVASGALWVATNCDRTLPTERGIAPGNGTLVAAVATAAGRDPIVVGKPGPALYLLCANVIGEPAEKVLTIGDRLDTDIAGAVAAGMDSVLVLTGVDDLAAVALAPVAMRPTFVLADLRGLDSDQEAATRDGDWWVSGGDRRRIRSDGRWESIAGEAEQAWQTGLSAIHEGLDSGRIDRDAALRLVSDLAGGQ